MVLISLKKNIRVVNQILKIRFFLKLLFLNSKIWFGLVFYNIGGNNVYKLHFKS